MLLGFVFMTMQMYAVFSDTFFGHGEVGEFWSLENLYFCIKIASYNFFAI